MTSERGREAKELLRWWREGVGEADWMAFAERVDALLDTEPADTILSLARVDVRVDDLRSIIAALSPQESKP